MTSTCQDRPRWLGPILRVVVTTPDLAGSVAAYRRGLGFTVRARGAVARRTADRWAAPAVAGASWALVGPASRSGGDVQLVQAPAVPGYAPLRTLGWAALEVSVGDLDAAVGGLTGDFSVIGRPGALSGPASVLRAAQVVGPAGEVIYLTEIRGELPPFQLPRTAPGVVADGVFAAVLASSELEHTRDWWEGELPVRRRSDRMATIGALNRALGRPEEATCRISSLQLAGRALVEIDQYPSDVPTRPVAPGGLPPGIALVAVGVPDSSTGPENDRRVVARGPDGELLEFVPAPQPIDVPESRL